MAKARKQRGLERKTIEADSRLAAILPGVAPGEKISPLDVTRKLSDYIRRENLAISGWQVRVNEPLATVSGLPEGHSVDRRVLISKIWSYIKGHGLQKTGPNHEIDEAFDVAKAQIKKKIERGEFSWDSAWTGLALAGAILLALIWLARQTGGQGQGGGGTPPSPPQ
jgi:chromatin remodeling complex protein RSC6